MSQPFMPLFFGDFLASTPTWDGEERALYLLLLAYQWSAGPLPDDVRRLARMAGYEYEKFECLWLNVVRSKFDATSEGLVNPRLEDHRQKALAISKKRAELGKAGAARRWKADGNSHSNSHDFANGKSMASIPYQTINTSIQKKKKPLAPAFESSTIDGLNQEAWKAWCDYRSAISKPLKSVSKPAAAKQLAKYGHQQMAVVEQSIANQWQGLFPLKGATTMAAQKESQFDRFMRLNGGNQKVIEHE
jgi:uncharacterized protein YdaU (DUF1376 family)